MRTYPTLALGKKYGPSNFPLHWRDRATQKPFMYQYKVNVGPYVVRRKTFNRVGGLNLNFSCAGSPGAGFDFEFSIRLWRQGYTVGLAELGFDHRSGGGDDGGDRSSSSGVALHHRGQGSVYSHHQN